MAADELREQNELADSVIAKLERIKALWEEMPTEDDLADLCRTAQSIAGSFESIKETWNSNDFPSGPEIEDLNKAVGSIAGGLEQVRDTYQSADFPSVEGSGADCRQGWRNRHPGFVSLLP